MRKKILIVEDEPRIRNLYQLLLGDSFDLIEAGNGKDAVEMATAHFPDLVVMDVMMPVMDGWQALATLKQEPATAMIPIILLTAKTTHRDVLAGYNLGAEYYITKPFKSGELMHGIHMCLDHENHPME